MYNFRNRWSFANNRLITGDRFLLQRLNAALSMSLGEFGELPPTLPCKLSQTLACVQALAHDAIDRRFLCNLKLACLSCNCGGREVEPVICGLKRWWQQRVTQTVMWATASGRHRKQLGDGNFTDECYQISLCKRVIWSLSLPRLLLLSSHCHCTLRSGGNVILSILRISVSTQ